VIIYASLDARAAALLLVLPEYESKILRGEALPGGEDLRSLGCDERLSLSLRRFSLRAILRAEGLAVVREARWDSTRGSFAEVWHVGLTRRETCASVRRSL
jgi:hypothetical protein